MAKNSEDAVGYKRPPKSHQFQPGQSGNPNGRPKGLSNFTTDVQEELGEMIAFREESGDVVISKQRALIKRLVTSAIGGDIRAITTLMSFCARAFAADDHADGDSPEDRDIVDAFAQRPSKRQDI
jgi:hypothetical protein